MGLENGPNGAGAGSGQESHANHLDIFEALTGQKIQRELTPVEIEKLQEALRKLGEALRIIQAITEPSRPQPETIAPTEAEKVRPALLPAIEVPVRLIELVSDLPVNSLNFASWLKDLIKESGIETVGQALSPALSVTTPGLTTSIQGFVLKEGVRYALEVADPELAAQITRQNLLFPDLTIPQEVLVSMGREPIEE